MKIAIIGTGISGLGIAYLLHGQHDITVYEKETYVGGHSRTITIKASEGDVAVDTGFIVYNEKNYPHLTRMFRHLDIPVSKSKMSFGASINNGWLEYSSTGLLAQKSNLFRPAFWGMVSDILRFNKQALAYLGGDDDITLRQCLDRMQMGAWFRQYYLQAMGAAIWSCSTETILDFPARTFLQFFDNHGLLTIRDHPQWYTVTGGSREYVSRLTQPFNNNIKTNCGVKSVIRHDDHVIITDSQGKSERYDNVIFACHADQALRMIQNPSNDERDILGKFAYQHNTVVVHRDLDLMPKHKKCWASWVYLSEAQQDQNPVVSLSYWMNNLQPLATKDPVIITLNPGRMPRPELTHNTHVFSHPVFTLDAIRAQRSIHRIQGQNRSYFCGAYQRYGFHEDGLLSAIKVAELIGVDIPWA